jgi:hypothetical protein
MTALDQVAWTPERIVDAQEKLRYACCGCHQPRLGYQGKRQMLEVQLTPKITADAWACEACIAKMAVMAHELQIYGETYAAVGIPAQEKQG